MKKRLFFLIAIFSIMIVNAQIRVTNYSKGTTTTIGGSSSNSSSSSGNSGIRVTNATQGTTTTIGGSSSNSSSTSGNSGIRVTNATKGTTSTIGSSSSNSGYYSGSSNTPSYTSSSTSGGSYSSSPAPSSYSSGSNTPSHNSSNSSSLLSPLNYNDDTYWLSLQGYGGDVGYNEGNIILHTSWDTTLTGTYRIDKNNVIHIAWDNNGGNELMSYRSDGVQYGDRLLRSESTDTYNNNTNTNNNNSKAFSYNSNTSQCISGIFYYETQAHIVLSDDCTYAMYNNQTGTLIKGTYTIGNGFERGGTATIIFVMNGQNYTGTIMWPLQGNMGISFDGLLFELD